MHARSLLSLVLIAGLAACSEDGGTGPSTNPLLGLKSTTATDSAGNTPTPTPPPAAGPGFFRGVVRSSEGTSGPDTLVTSIRIPGVQIVAYARRADGSPGDAVANTTSNAQGEWQLSTLPSGEYVVTFVPPTNSGYQGVWVLSTASPTSHEWQWWVTLPKT